MNHETVTFVLVIAACLQLKHFVCDGPLQTAEMVQKKSIYGAPLGILHSGLHGISTGLVFLIANFPTLPVFGLAVLDFVIHYHVDYTKENVVKYFRWTAQDAKFWWAMSADQTLHQLTYLLLVAIAFKA